MNVDRQYTWDDFIRIGYGQKINCTRNTFLFYQGEIGKGFYYLEKGEVKISLLSDQGVERDIDYVLPGELLGEHGFNNSPYVTSAFVTTPSVLYFFSMNDFNQLCLDIPIATSLFMDALIRKVRILAETTSFLNAPANFRLAHFLYKHCQEKEAKIKFRQISVARFIGTSRITVYKIISQWEKEGMINYHNGYFYILDINKLKAFLKIPFEDPQERISSET